MFIGLFVDASTVTIASGIDTAWTLGYDTAGQGSARFMYDPAVDATYVTANPLTSFLSANSRGFRLSLDQDLYLEQFGAVGDDTTDNADAFDAATDLPGATVLHVGAGVFLTSRPLTLLTGQSLIGAGRAQTILRKIPITDPLEQTEETTVVDGAVGASDIRLADFSVDANRSGLGMGGNQRCNGTRMRIGANAVVERVDVYNATGYGHYFDGVALSTATYRDCWSYNCQVHFEQTGAPTVVLVDNCHARNSGGLPSLDADGDIPMEAAFHQYGDMRCVELRSCSFIGEGAGLNVFTGLGEIQEVRIIDCDFLTTSSSISAVTGGGGDPIGLLVVTGSTFKSDLYVGAQFADTTVIRASQSLFDGAGIGIDIPATVGIAYFAQCTAIGRSDPMGTDSAWGLYAFGTCVWDGGKLEAIGPVNKMNPMRGPVTLGTTVIRSPAPAFVASQIEAPAWVRGPENYNLPNNASVLSMLDVHLDAAAVDGAGPIISWSGRYSATGTSTYARAVGFLIGPTPTSGAGGLDLQVASASGTFGVSGLRIATTSVEPLTDNAIDLGAPSKRIKNSYFAVSPTVSSDAAGKMGDQEGAAPMRDVTEAERRVALRLLRRKGLYKLKEAVAGKGWDKARWHAGILGQEVITAFEAEGLNGLEYGIVGYDDVEGSRLSIRYDELDSFVDAAVGELLFDLLEQRVASSSTSH